MRAQTRKTVLLGCLAAAFVAACSQSPLGRSQFLLVSDAQVNQAGAASFREMQAKIPQSRDTRQVAYVNCVSAAIINEIPRLQTPGRLRVPAGWEIALFDSKDINAFALPGGKVGVYTGLLRVATTQDQLAAVVGHEVTHVLAGHSAERYSQTVTSELGGAVVQVATGIDGQLLGLASQAFFLLPFSRAHETEADLLGLDLMATAGFDPRQAIALWQNMARASGGKPPQFLSSHPSDETRIRKLSERLNTAMPLFERARVEGRAPRCGA
jgi:predicted Zn-dependent protease